MFLTINEEKLEEEIVEKKSRFIGTMFYVDSEEKAQAILKDIKKQYYDARHNCFAYRVMTENGVVERFSDDGEPSGTAGGPMLNILAKNNLCNVLVVVTRYFGGILLGTGGLVRAYSKSVKEVLSIATTIDLELGYRVQITASYSKQKELDYLLRNTLIIKKEYQEKIEYEVLISKDSIQLLNNYDHKILKEEYIPKRNNYL